MLGSASEPTPWTRRGCAHLPVPGSDGKVRSSPESILFQAASIQLLRRCSTEVPVVRPFATRRRQAQGSPTCIAILGSLRFLGFGMGRKTTRHLPRAEQGTSGLGRSMETLCLGGAESDAGEEAQKNPCGQQEATPQRTHWLATRGRTRRERRYPFNFESGTWCGRCTCDSQQLVSRGDRRSGGWSHFDGCRRVRVCPLTGGYRAG